METSRPLVIKVKYGDMLRRFSPVVDGELNLSMDAIRRKIQSLYSLDPSADLMLTYIDDDGDTVALFDDDDLDDAVKQALNPLRITVKLCSEKNSSRDAFSTATSTPSSLPQVNPSTQNLNTGVSELLKAVPEPLRETLMKLSSDLTSKAASSAPGVTELLDSTSKLGLPYLNRIKEPVVQSSTRSGVPGRMAAAGTEDTEVCMSDLVIPYKVTSNIRSGLSCNDECSDKLKAEAIINNSVTGGSTENPLPLPDFYAAAVGNYSQKVNVAQPGDNASLSPMPASVHLKSGVVSHGVGKKKKAKDFSQCFVMPNIKGFSYSRGFLPYIPPGNVEKIDEPHVTSPGIPSATNDVATGEKANYSNQAKLESCNTSVGVPGPKSVKDDEAQRLSGSFGARSLDWAHSPVRATVDNASFVPPVTAPAAVLFGRSTNQNNGSRNVFHHGVCCDGCGIHPIVGPRFISKVKTDYDLCSACFDRIGNDSVYIRMDFPVYRDQAGVRGYPGSVCRGPKVKSVPVKLDSRFIQDVNIIDGTVMEPLTPFTKIWRMKNNGMVVWCQGIRLVWIGGDRLSNALSVELEIPSDGLWMNQEIDVAVEFTSPKLPGRYISYWQMATPSGQKFGQRVWVLIQVDASVKESPRRSVESPRESIRNLNLNLPPLSSITGAEIINVNPEPTAGDNHLEPDNSNKKVELVQPSTEQELKFPINDNLLVGNMASNSANPSASSVSYPIIDLSDMISPLPLLPSVYYPLPEPVAAPPKPASPVTATLQPEAVLEKEQIEDKLLRELQEMGFKQVNLNKEVLRMNEYDLERTVTDLCGTTEWDPMLEELEEMGFHDRQMNKMLLKKNNGSIKRVVMDLITGEMN